MAVPLLIALKTIAEIGAAVQAVNGAYNFFEDKVKDVDKSQIILETVRRQMAQYQAEMEEQARIMEERKAFLEAEGRDTNSVAYLTAKSDYDNARNKYFATEAQLAKLRNQEANLLAQLSHREQSNNYMPQSSAGVGQGYGGGYGMLAGAQAVDYNKMVSENKNFAERNRLMYEAKPINEQYIADMQKIIDEENEFGTTIENQAEKIDLYNRRLNELAGEKTKLQDFMKTLQDDFDSEIVKNSELMSAIGYDTSAADDVKAARIAANKETISSVKELSSLLSLMAEIENKIKNLDEEQRSVQQNLKSMYVSKKPEDIYAQKMLTMQNEYAIKAKALGTPLNSDEQRRATVAQIEYLKQVMIEQEQQIYNWEKELQSDKAKNDMAEYQRIKNLLDAEKVLRAEHAGQMRDLEYQKNAQIREGLAGIAVDFFIQGNTLRSIWSNLWKDLAREAILRLFKVKAEASLLGLILGMFGGGASSVGNANKRGAGLSGIINQYGTGSYTGIFPLPKTEHTGGNISVFPRMHSGGNVMAGRIGLVPALKDDEVLRTLQVGEEVNSIRDRRSNEILATVAMRAMDNTAKAPTQVVITALDSRSFAEYLNENSDILQAVLAKNNAMGRRA